MSHWQDTPGKTQKSLEGLCVLCGNALESLLKSVLKENLSFSPRHVASVTGLQISGRRLKWRLCLSHWVIEEIMVLS